MASSSLSAGESFDDLLGRLAVGDQSAPAEIFDRFGNRLIGLARSRLDSRIRQKVDPEDVLQSVFRSFFVRQADGQFELSSWESLWSPPVCMTLRKCGRQVDVYRAAMRDVGREAVKPTNDEQSQRAWEGIAREPSPQEVAALAETVEHLMRRLDERRRQIVTLRLQGFTVPEISESVQISERSVFRALGRAREILDELEPV